MYFEKNAGETDNAFVRDMKVSKEIPDFPASYKVMELGVLFILSASSFFVSPFSSRAKLILAGSRF